MTLTEDRNSESSSISQPRPFEPERMRTPDLAHRLCLWIILCFVAAAPSFYWAHEEYDWWGMIAGIATFAVTYAVLTGQERVRSRLQQPFVRRTVKIGYGARIVISVVFPIGLAADLYPGMLSLMVTEELFGNSKGFARTYATTLVQGVLLNTILSGFMGVVYGFQRAILKQPNLKGLCLNCGYDLRGTPERCPECGLAATTPNAVGSAAINPGKTV